VHQRAGLGQAAVDVHRADHRLEGVGQDRGLVPAAGDLLAPAEPDVVAQAELARHLGERAHLDHRGTELGQLSLGQVRVAAEQGVGHDQAENRVAEELEPLVGGRIVVLVGVGAMRQRALE